MAAHSTPGRAPRRILLADDDDEMRAMLRTLLGRQGYEVTEAWDGADLIAKLAAGLHDGSARPDLIISDIRMPWSSGLLVLDRLRRSGCDIPVILMTAFGDEMTHAQARRLGAALLLDKPFPIEVLRKAVQSILG